MGTTSQVFREWKIFLRIFFELKCLICNRCLSCDTYFLWQNDLRDGEWSFELNLYMGLCFVQYSCIALEWHYCANAWIHIWFICVLLIVVHFEKVGLKLYLFIRLWNIVDWGAFVNTFIFCFPITVVGQSVGMLFNMFLKLNWNKLFSFYKVYRLQLYMIFLVCFLLNDLGMNLALEFFLLNLFVWMLS